MAIEVKVPSPGESITEVEIGSWLVKDQDYVEKDQDIAEVESDKATLTIVADEAGVITIKADEGEMVAVNTVVAIIDTDAKAPKKKEEKPKEEVTQSPVKEEKKEKKEAIQDTKTEDTSTYDKVKVTSVAKQMMQEHDLSLEDVINGLKRIGKKEIEAVSNLPKQPALQKREISRAMNEQRMSSLRRKVSARLVSVKNETAMLTTFNEIDMSAIMSLRKQYQSKFVEKYGFKVGFMSF
ncbi:MAG: 2-oxoglutarate dehydrogenase, partial [Draconibacterium sp.]